MSLIADNNILLLHSQRIRMCEAVYKNISKSTAHRVQIQSTEHTNIALNLKRISFLTVSVHTEQILPH